MHSSDRCSSSFNLPPGKSHPVSKDRFKIKLFTLTQVMDVGNQPLHSAPPKICPKYSDKTYMYFLLTQLQRLVPSDGSLTFRPRPLQPPPPTPPPAASITNIWNCIVCPKETLRLKCWLTPQIFWINHSLLPVLIVVEMSVYYVRTDLNKPQIVLYPRVFNTACPPCCT